MSTSIPERRCDVVMKGGITSGVVYPLAIVELSHEFRFKNIGGTSAGAIAAALTAAAEYRRVTAGGSRAGFDALAALPAFLGGTTGGQPNLLNLFPPARPARRLFAVASAFLGDASLGAKLLRALLALVRLTPLGALLALVLIAVPLVAPPGASPFGIAWLVLVELMAAVTGLLLVLLFGLRRAVGVLPANGFGFSTGMAPPDCKLPGVTEWLHAEIQRLAGRGPDDAPLTFGDLWSAEATQGEREDVARRCEQGLAPRAIDLQMITTALSQGRPYRLPFENHRFSFKEAELRRYFPERVVRQLLETGADDASARTSGFCPLPAARNMPLIVAARMSLSFPLLFSMVPLYAVDFTLKKNQGDKTKPEPERCWFIDGGLSSNFPVTLFDAPLPRWPTFCINLADFHPDYPKDEHDESKNVWMVRSNGNGTSDRWLRFPTSGLRGVFGYVGAMLDTIRTWHDNTQLTVPGYRDRIAHVQLSPDEGGLNLDMDEKRVTSLSMRGHFAGAELRARFGAKGAEREGLNWNTHRWTRFRSTMALMQRALRQSHDAVNFVDPAYISYGNLIARMQDDNPRTGYWWARSTDAYQALTKRYLETAQELAKAGLSFEEDSPGPRPDLQITPRL